MRSSRGTARRLARSARIEGKVAMIETTGISRLSPRIEG
jgi:hypothetical protein